MLKRKIILGVIAITIISGVLVGCTTQNSKNAENDTSTSVSNSSKTSKTEQTNQTSNTNNSANNKTGNEKNTVSETYYGQWKISKKLASHRIYTYGEDDIKALIGRKLTFSKESATCFGDQASYLDDTAVNPTYTKSVISKTDFETDTFVTFDILGIKGNSITEVDVEDANGNHCLFYIKDNNTLILYGGNVYLQLNKI